VGPTGNFYDLVIAPKGLSWPEAKAAAENSTIWSTWPFGNHTSQVEDFYVENLRLLSPPVGVGGRAWVGGYQDPSIVLQGKLELGQWRGPIPGINGTEIYANWSPGEPNDALGWATENYLSIGLWLAWNDDGWLQGDGKLFGYIAEYDAPVMAIDIKPGGSPNVINLGSGGRLPVAVLSSPKFDVGSLDRATITFGRTGVEAVPVKFSVEDGNGDKLKDLICHFNTQDTGFDCGSTVGILKAKTLTGWPVSGSDSIRALPCAPFELSVQAMQDVNKLTDIYTTVCAAGRNCVAPIQSPHIQVKSTDLLGHTRWVANEHEVPLVPNESNTCSTAELQYSFGAAPALRGEGSGAELPGQQHRRATSRRGAAPT
jgi:hypothetical protein